MRQIPELYKNIERVTSYFPEIEGGEIRPHDETTIYDPHVNCEEGELVIHFSQENNSVDISYLAHRDGSVKQIHYEENIPDNEVMLYRTIEKNLEEDIKEILGS